MAPICGAGVQDRARRASRGGTEALAVVVRVIPMMHALATSIGNISAVDMRSDLGRKILMVSRTVAGETVRRRERCGRDTIEACEERPRAAIKALPLTSRLGERGPRAIAARVETEIW